MRRYLPFVIVIGVALLAIGGGAVLYRAKRAANPAPKISKTETERPGEIVHVLGPANARVTLEEFGDFQCPPCGKLADTLLKVEHDYGTSVRVVFREFPLPMHEHAQTAARAAEAAGLQGRFWEMHDLLFQNALSTWAKESARPFIRVIPAPNASPDENAVGVRAIFSGYAKTLGLDEERFKKDIDSEEVKARIKSD